jgi:hypothetical protein
MTPCSPSSFNLIQTSVLYARKPNSLAFSKVFSLAYFWTVLKINSKCFDIVDMRIIGFKFGGNFGSLPGSGRVMIFVSS